uniref:Uncharacterized protein n=1 Tax=Anguilla anguilla TaxID=7936 RepID=A0A0E9XEP1_ANGAN
MPLKAQLGGKEQSLKLKMVFTSLRHCPGSLVPKKVTKFAGSNASVFSAQGEL